MHVYYMLVKSEVFVKRKAQLGTVEAVCTCRQNRECKAGRKEPSRMADG